MPVDLPADLPDLLMAITDIESVSGNEGPLADAVAAALSAHPHLVVERDGDAVVARTDLGRGTRVVVAGHLDTVPVAANLPSRREGDLIYGRGTCDMKGGVAVMLAAAAELSAPRHDVTWIFYDNEEVEAVKNGLGRLARTRPDLLAGDFAVLMEPTGARIEGGCQGTLRFEVTTTGTAALGLGDLRRRITQRRADLVDVELDDGALLALLGLVRARLQPPRHDHAGAAVERLGDVLGRVTPHRAAHEEGLPVLPLVGLAVERARRGCHGEVRDRSPRGGESEFGVGGEVSHHGDDGFAGHEP